MIVKNYESAFVCKNSEGRKYILVGEYDGCPFDPREEYWDDSYPVAVVYSGRVFPRHLELDPLILAIQNDPAYDPEWEEEYLEDGETPNPEFVGYLEPTIDSIQEFAEKVGGLFDVKYPDYDTVVAAFWSKSRMEARPPITNHEAFLSSIIGELCAYVVGEVMRYSVYDPHDVVEELRSHDWDGRFKDIGDVEDLDETNVGIVVAMSECIDSLGGVYNDQTPEEIADELLGLEIVNRII